MWYRPPATYGFLPQSNWSLTAAGTVSLEPGTYSLRTISDDAVRVWVDGALVIDDWTPHESQVDYATLPPGKHDLRVEYRQVDGWRRAACGHHSRVSAKPWIPRATLASLHSLVPDR